MTRRVPIFLAPLPGESARSWLEAYAHRLGITLGELMNAVELPIERDWSVAFSDDEAIALAHACSLAPEDIHRLTLARWEGVVGRIDEHRRLFASHTWHRRLRVPFCPSCFRDDQGRWRLLWHTGWAFACTRHSVLLADACDGCGHAWTSYSARRRRVPIPGLCRTLLAAAAAPDGQPRGRCVRPLAETTARALDPDGAVVTAQRRIERLLDTDAAENCDPTELRAWLGDVYVVARNTLMALGHDTTAPSVVANIVAEVGSPITPARPNGGPTAETAVDTAIGTTAALAALDHAAEGDLTTLRWISSTVWRADGRWGNRSLQERWGAGSDYLHAHVLSSIASEVRTSVRLRSGTVGGRTGPDPKITRARATSVPAMFWPEWAIRLTPPGLMDPTYFRAVLSALILLPGSQATRAEVVAALGDHVPPGALSHALGRLRRVEAGERVLAVLTQLAQALDDRGSPIDYARRRDLLAEGVDVDRDRLSAICRQHGTVPTSRLHREIGRYIYEILTCSDPSNPSAPCRVDTAQQRQRWRQARHRFPAHVRAFCHAEAESILNDAGITEPVRWEPPLSWVPDLAWPGREPDDIDVVQLTRLVEAGATEASAARLLGITVEHVRHALDQHRIPADSLRSARAVRRPRKKRHLVRRQGCLAPDQLRALYQDEHYSLREIAEMAGCSRHAVTLAAREAGIEMRPVGSVPKAIRRARPDDPRRSY